NGTLLAHPEIYFETGSHRRRHALNHTNKGVSDGVAIRICKASMRCLFISRSFLPLSNTRAIPQQHCSPEKIALRSKNCIARSLQSSARWVCSRRAEAFGHFH